MLELRSGVTAETEDLSFNTADRWFRWRELLSRTLGVHRIHDFLTLAYLAFASTKDALNDYIKLYRKRKIE